MRLKNAAKNSFFAVLGQIVLIVVGFFSQRAMNMTAGAQLAGVNGVISNVIAILSVTELGMSTAIVYNLYPCIRDNDEKRCASIMNLYRKAYTIFASVIMVLGLICLPFIHLIIKETTYTVGYIRLMFLLWLVRTALSYLLSYRRSILIADQREYQITIITLFVNIINYTSIIILLYTVGEYLVALGLNIVVEIVANIIIIKISDIRYPYLRQYRHLKPEKEVVDSVIDNVKNLFVGRIFTKLLNSTDNLIISGFINTLIAGLYSNYFLIINAIIGLMYAVSAAVKPTFGHMFLDEDREKDVKGLRLLTFIFFLMMSVVVSVVFSISNIFVQDIWLGEKFLFPQITVAFLCIQLFLTCIGFPLETVIGVTGLFDKDRNISIATAVVNLVVSLVTVSFWGIHGVILGTICAFVTMISLRIKVFFKDYTGLPVKDYLLDLAGYILLTILSTEMSFLIVHRVYDTFNIGVFLLICIISVVIPVVLDLLVYCRTDRFRETVSVLKGLLGSKE